MDVIRGWNQSFDETENGFYNLSDYLEPSASCEGSSKPGNDGSICNNFGPGQNLYAKWYQPIVKGDSKPLFPRLSDGDILNVDCFDNYKKWNVTSVELGYDATTTDDNDVFDLFGLDSLDVFCWWGCDDVQEDPWWELDEQDLNDLEDMAEEWENEWDNEWDSEWGAQFIDESGTFWADKAYQLGDGNQEFYDRVMAATEDAREQVYWEIMAEVGEQAWDNFGDEWDQIMGDLEDQFA